MTTTDIQNAPPPAGWGRRALGGAAALGGSSAVIHGLSFVRTALLARLLVPEFFGIVALAESLLSVVKQLQELNFDIGLMYRQTRHPQTVAANVVLKGLFSGVLLLILAAGYGWLRQHYDPRVVAILLWFGVGSVIQTLGGTPRILLERNFRFTEVVWIQVAGAVVRTIIPVAMAAAGMGLLSLVVASLLDMVLPALGFWWRYPVRFTAPPSRDDFRWFFQFSWPVWAGSILNMVCYSLGHVLVGTLLGATVLGFYALAFTFARFPVQFVVHAISRATFPAYAKFQQDAVLVTRIFQLAMTVICWCLIPAAALGAFLAPDAIRWVLGERWMAAVPLLQGFCVFLVLRGAQDHAMDFLNAMGHTPWFRNVLAVEAAVLVAGSVFAVRYAGAPGMVWVTNGMLLCGLPYLWHYVRRVARVDVRAMVQLPLLASLGMAVAMLVIEGTTAPWPVPLRVAMKLIAAVSAGALVAWWAGRAQLITVREDLRAFWRGDLTGQR